MIQDEISKDYMKDVNWRHALNELTEATFGFNFENMMHFLQNGEERHYIQIGTVMTAADRRKQGLAAKLMKCVIEEYEGKCDGIYLFGDLSALDFYRKMGFEETVQYRYILREDVKEDWIVMWLWGQRSPISPSGRSQRMSHLMCR